MVSKLTLKSARKGFTLIEAAIVLGIIGLIAGAIWVGASSVFEAQKNQRATQVLLQIVQGVRTLYANQAVFTTASDIAPALANAKILPQDMWIDTATGTPPVTNGVYDGGDTTTTPWGGASRVHVFPSNNTQQFQVLFDNVPAAACTQLLVRNSGSAISGLVGASATSAASQPTALTAFTAVGTPVQSVDPATANTSCANTFARVSFVYNLRS